MNTEVELGKSCKVRQLTPDECLERVHDLANFLLPAFKHAAGEVDAWTALKACALGQMQCFIGEDNDGIIAAMITSFCDYPLKRVCDIVAYAGKARNFYWFEPTLEGWARANGATEMRGYGTEAAMRLARERHGYQEVYRVYTKSL